MLINSTPKTYRNLRVLVAGTALALASSQWTACGGSGVSKTVDAGGNDVAAGGTLGRGGADAVGGASGHASGGAGGIQVASGGAGGKTSAQGGISGGTGGGTSSGHTQCNDGLDNDGDGKIDLNDPECVSPLDDDESSFATGIPGDNVDACKQDCFFDGNSGMGDDHCNWELKCDPSNVGASAEKKCEYDPNFNNCPMSQPQSCIDFCRPLTPNGCDCFGCCAVGTATAPLSVRLTATCTAAKFGDPMACPPCTQTTTCINDCKPCELCLGKTTLPPECYTGAGGAGGAPGGIECLNAVTCGTDQTVCDKTGTICVSGCCVSAPS